jgi:hypothetical protein
MRALAHRISSTPSLEHRGHRRGRAAHMKRAILAALGALVFGLGSPGRAQHGEHAITCTNPASGATWQIKIDYDKSTVDSNPARISPSEITWRDLKDGWNYTLDRKSGNLTVIIASATGGNFLYDRCKLEN